MQTANFLDYAREQGRLSGEVRVLKWAIGAAFVALVAALGAIYTEMNQGFRDVEPQVPGSRTTVPGSRTTVPGREPEIPGYEPAVRRCESANRCIDEQRRRRPRAAQPESRDAWKASKNASCSWTGTSAASEPSVRRQLPNRRRNPLRRRNRRPAPGRRCRAWARRERRACAPARPGP